MNDRMFLSKLQMLFGSTNKKIDTEELSCYFVERIEKGIVLGLELEVSTIKDSKMRFSWTTVKRVFEIPDQDELIIVRKLKRSKVCKHFIRKDDLTK